MYGTMPDFSQFKHTDLTDDCGSYVNGSLLASSITDSFGDKTIYYRIYTTNEKGGVTLSGFDIFGIVIYHEGDHPTFEEMLEEAERLLKRVEDAKRLLK